MRTSIVAGLVFCGLTIAPVIVGQPPQAQERPAAPPRFGPFAQRLLGEDWEQRDVQELMEVVMMVRLSKELDLSEEDTVVMVRRFQELKTRFNELNEQRQAALKTLREAVKANEDAGAVQSKLDALMALDRELVTMKQRAFENVSSELDPIQQAKLYVFLRDFENQMRRLVERARQYRAGYGKGPGQGEVPPGPGRLAPPAGPARREEHAAPGRSRRAAPARGAPKSESAPEESGDPAESTP